MTTSAPRDLWINVNCVTGTEIESRSDYTQTTKFRETMMDVRVITNG